MDKEITTIDYQLPPSDLLNEYIPESKMPENEIAGKGSGNQECS